MRFHILQWLSNLWPKFQTYKFLFFHQISLQDMLSPFFDTNIKSNFSLFLLVFFFHEFFFFFFCWFLFFLTFHLKHTVNKKSTRIILKLYLKPSKSRKLLIRKILVHFLDIDTNNFPHENQLTQHNLSNS